MQANERMYLIEWKIRPDGFKPISSYINEKEIEEADKQLMIKFLQ